MPRRGEVRYRQPFGALARMRVREQREKKQRMCKVTLSLRSVLQSQPPHRPELSTERQTCSQGHRNG